MLYIECSTLSDEWEIIKAYFLPESTPIMSRPMMSISKDLDISPRDRSTAAITAKLLFSNKVPFLKSVRKIHEKNVKIY